VSFRVIKSLKTQKLVKHSTIICFQIKNNVTFFLLAVLIAMGPATQAVNAPTKGALLAETALQGNYN
jgi:hypothetical protein